MIHLNHELHNLFRRAICLAQDVSVWVVRGAGIRIAATVGTIMVSCVPNGCRCSRPCIAIGRCTVVVGCVATLGVCLVPVASSAGVATRGVRGVPVGLRGVRVSAVGICAGSE